MDSLARRLSRGAYFSLTLKTCRPVKCDKLRWSRLQTRQISTYSTPFRSISGWLPWTIACFGVSTSLILLRSSQKRAEAEEPTGPKEPDQGTASTLPLHAVGALQYDLSEENLRGAYEDLVRILGEDNVDLRRAELIIRSSTEWSPAPNGEADIPSMIVFPRDTQDVSGIARICHRRRIPMIGFSGGTSLEGTLAAQHKEVCVDFNRHMNKVLEIRKDDMDVTVQPSVGYQDLNRMLEEDGLFFPVDPGPGAQFGGMIAQGCSGTNAYRYGTMKDWVLGLEVVLADGTIIKTRGRARKSSSGFDLTRLFTGSEGTLGFVTKAHLRISRTPQNLRIAVAQFPTVGDAVQMAVKVLQSGYQLEAMELLDEFTMHGVNEGGYCSTQWPEKPTLFMKLANPSSDVVEQIATIVEAFARDCGSTFFKLAQTDEEGDEIWYARKTALWSLLALKTDPSDEFISSDPCVPISKLGEIVTRSQELLEKSGMLGSILGHVGDGNIHASALYIPAEKEKALQVMYQVQRFAVDLEGTVSGEHGLGLGYRDQLDYELGQESVDAMRKIKSALDPLYLMNPGKMIRVE